MPCTTILAGKGATYDGSTMMARNEDSPSGVFTSKAFIVVNPEDQPKEYQSKLSKFYISLTEKPLRYTAMPDAPSTQGVWGEAGVNEANVAMTETETITSNARVLGADPLVKDGIGEEDMLTLVLPYIHSAREGVLRLGKLLETYGTYEMNGIGFQDKDEIWWFESVGGHHWMARRVPDECYVVMPNQQGIDWLDLEDAFGDKKQNLCSSDLREFISENHLDLSPAGGAEQGTHVKTIFGPRLLDARAAFGSHDDSDHTYNTPRAWWMERVLSPSRYVWEGPQADFGPESDNLPWCLTPDHKLSPEDVKYVLSGVYQGTPYDLYAKHPDPEAGKYRPIGINRNNFMALTQIRPYMPEDIAAVEWIAEGCNVYNSMIPFYTHVTKTPAYLADTTGDATTDNFYWVNRLIAALADAHHAKAAIHIERYQNATAAQGHALLHEYDRKYREQQPADATAFLEGANEKLAAMAKAEAQKALNNVLYEASNGMKNGFARSDA